MNQRRNIDSNNSVDAENYGPRNKLPEKLPGCRTKKCQSCNLISVSTVVHDKVTGGECLTKAWIKVGPINEKLLMINVFYLERNENVSRTKLKPRGYSLPSILPISGSRLMVRPIVQPSRSRRVIRLDSPHPRPTSKSSPGLLTRRQLV
jgi:hypothetical protein